MEIRFLTLLFLMLSFTSCATGWLYTDTVVPYCTEMDSVTSKGTPSSSSLKMISVPRVPGLRATWSTNSIVDAAKENNLTNVYYCDRKRYSVFGGLWGSDSLLVYGE